MTRSTGRRLLGVLLGVTLCGQLACSDGQTTALGNDDSGRTVAVSAGDELDITLGSIASNQGNPIVSSTSIHFMGSSLVGPATPAGPVILYKFTAVSRGVATITIPFIGPTNPAPFTVDVNVE